MLDSLFGNKAETGQRDGHRGEGTEVGRKGGLLGAPLGRAPPDRAFQGGGVRGPLSVGYAQPRRDSSLGVP